MTAGAVRRPMPEVSVVMGVFDGAPTLPKTLASVLSQDGVDLEFIVVDDGSSDATSTILAQAAATDLRVRVHRLEKNGGLTAALITGCGLAGGEFIARQDCGDLSLSGRFASQAEHLRANPDAPFSTVQTRFRGVFGETVRESNLTQKKLSDGLLVDRVDKLVGPTCHGSVMMRRSAYEKVGGYRSKFRVAQDLDLWLRMRELSQPIVHPEILYEAEMSAYGISSLSRSEQIMYAKMAIIDLGRNVPETDPGNNCAQMHHETLPVVAPRKGRLSEAAFLYFIGRLHQRRGNPYAGRYFREAIRLAPWHLQSWLALFRASISP